MIKDRLKIFQFFFSNYVSSGVKFCVLSGIDCKKVLPKSIGKLYVFCNPCLRARIILAPEMYNLKKNETNVSALKNRNNKTVPYGSRAGPDGFESSSCPQCKNYL